MGVFCVSVCAASVETTDGRSTRLSASETGATEIYGKEETLPKLVGLESKFGRRVEARKLCNDIRVVVIQMEEAEEVVLRVTVRCGILDFGPLFRVFEAFLNNRFKRIKDEKKHEGEMAVSCDYTHYTLRCSRRDFERESDGFLKHFCASDHDGDTENKAVNGKADLGNILEKVIDGRFLSGEELRLWMRDVFLRSGIDVVVCGGVSEENIGSIYSGFISVRNVPERNPSTHEVKSRRERLLRCVENMAKKSSEPGCVMILKIPYIGDGIFKRNLLNLILDIANHRDEVEVKNIWKKHRCIGRSLESTCYKGLIVVKAELRILDAMFADYEELLKALFVYLKRFRISNDEYHKIARIRGDGESPDAMSCADIVERVSTGLVYYPVRNAFNFKNALNFENGYGRFKDLLQMISDIENWELSISLNGKSIVLNEEIKARIGARIRSKLGKQRVLKHAPTKENEELLTRKDVVLKRVGGKHVYQNKCGMCAYIADYELPRQESYMNIHLKSNMSYKKEALMCLFANTCVRLFEQRHGMVLFGYSGTIDFECVSDGLVFRFIGFGSATPEVVNAFFEDFYRQDVENEFETIKKECMGWYLRSWNGGIASYNYRWFPAMMHEVRQNAKACVSKEIASAEHRDLFRMALVGCNIIGRGAVDPPSITNLHLRLAGSFRFEKEKNPQSNFLKCLELDIDSKGGAPGFAFFFNLGMKSSRNIANLLAMHSLVSRMIHANDNGKNDKSCSTFVIPIMQQRQLFLSITVIGSRDTSKMNNFIEKYNESLPDMDEEEFKKDVAVAIEKSLSPEEQRAMNIFLTQIKCCVGSCYEPFLESLSPEAIRKLTIPKDKMVIVMSDLDGSSD